MPRCRFHLAFGLMLFALPEAANANDRIELIDGETINASVSSIANDGELAGDGLDRQINVAELLTIVRPTTESEAASGGIVVDLAQGGRLRVKEITLAEEKCRIESAPLGNFEMPIDALRAVRFDLRTPSDAFQSAVDKPIAGADRLFVKAGERIQPIAGLIDMLTEETVVFLREGDEVRLPRTRVYGIVLADVGGPNVDGARCRVALRDGSVIPGTLAKLADGLLTLKVSRSVELSLSWDLVSRIDVQSPRLAYLSDLKPAEVVEQSIVAVSRPWKRDRNVIGGTLELNLTENQTRKTVEYKRGIGSHSRCRLTFEMDGDYNTFLATVGIDAGTQGKGDCMISVLVDGEPRYSKRITGRDGTPHEIRIDVGGGRSLTIAVEPGHDLDLADHVNWCDARLIRKPS